MDGMAMLKKLREDAWGKNAKVIMLTNLSDIKNVVNAINQQSYDYLVKSDWKLEDVVAKIRQRLGE
jgi:DNA-binding response OmpR family regulator